MPPPDGPQTRAAPSVLPWVSRPWPALQISPIFHNCKSQSLKLNPPPHTYILLVVSPGDPHSETFQAPCRVWPRSSLGVSPLTRATSTCTLAAVSPASIPVSHLVAHHRLREVLHTGQPGRAAPGHEGLSPSTRGRYRINFFLIGMWKQQSRATVFIAPDAAARESGVGPMLGCRISHVGHPGCSGGLAFGVSPGSAQPETPGVSWPDGQHKWTCGWTAQMGVGMSIMQTRPPEEPGCGKEPRKPSSVQETLGNPRTTSLKLRTGQGLCTCTHSWGPAWPLQFSPISVPVCGSDSFRTAVPSPRLQRLEWQDPLPTAHQGLGLEFEQLEQQSLSSNDQPGARGSRAQEAALSRHLSSILTHVSVTCLHSQTERLVPGPHPQWALGIQDWDF